MNIFIATDNESTGSRVRDVLLFGGQDCPIANIVPIDDAAGRLGRESHIDLVVMVMPADREHGLAELVGFPSVAQGKVVVVGPTSDAKLVLRALRAGAIDFVDIADLETELEASLSRMAESSRVEQGGLIAVIAPSGGSGSSMIATNIATALASKLKGVALLDFKLQTGDLSSMLDLRPTFTLADLCQNSARLDRTMFERSLVKHSSGVHLLAPPLGLAEVDHVRSEGVTLTLGHARACFPVIVADVDHSYREEQLVVLRQADVILVVFRLDFVSLRNVKRSLEYMDSLDIPRDRVRLVVNRHGQTMEIPVVKAEEALGMKISHFVPEDVKGINRSINHGVPVVLEAASSKVSKSLTQLAINVGHVERRRGNDRRRGTGASPTGNERRGVGR